MPSTSFSVQSDVSDKLDTYKEKHGLGSRTQAIQKLLKTVEDSIFDGESFTCKKCNTSLEKRCDLMEMSQ
mgnify:CR=1 FL=1